MNRWTTIVVAALLAVPAVAQRTTEGTGPERRAPERSVERPPRTNDDLDALRREVQRLRQRVERLQNQRGSARPAPQRAGRGRGAIGPGGPRGGALRDRLEELRAHADRNHDGQLDQAERDAARAAIQRRVHSWRETRAAEPRPDAQRRSGSDAQRRSWSDAPGRPGPGRPPRR